MRTCSSLLFQATLCLFIQANTLVLRSHLAWGSMVPRYLIIYLRYAIKETDHTYVLFSI